MIFKIATWNVNSLKVRLPQVLEWLKVHQPAVLALQETKMVDQDFPLGELQQAGYHAVFSGQRTYNGMAILSQQPVSQVVTDIPNLEDSQRRILAATYEGIRIINLYVPNGQSVESEKYAYKLNWLTQITHFLQQELERHERVIVLGDFNIAPSAEDVCDPLAWAGQVLVSEPERAAFFGILQLGFQDCFRLQPQAEKMFSWWDYRLNAFRRNLGLRIDHILANTALAAHYTRCYIDKMPRAAERPSDHAPVIAEFELGQA